MPCNSEIQNITQEFLSLIKLPTEKGKKLNYLIVVPLTISGNAYEQFNTPGGDEQYDFPLGIAYVSAALKASGRQVFALNLNYKIEPKKLLDHCIKTKNIDVVLTGGYSVNFRTIKMITDSAKESKPDIVTIVGGAIITADPVAAMQAIESADYGVIGEGEITVNSLAYALETGANAADVDGVICLRGGEWSIRPEYPSIPDLDLLPFPDYEGLEYSHLFERVKSVNANGCLIGVQSCYVAHISVSRSCPYKCTFCFHPCGGKPRRMSIGVVEKLLDWLLSLYPIEAVFALDELTLINDFHALEFSKLMMARDLRWTASVRADSLAKETLSIIKENGCVSLFLGIESASNDILKSMRKGVTIEQVEEILEEAARIGLLIIGGLIFGDPEETMDTFLHTIDWWQRSPFKSSIHLGRIFAFPGSHNYISACERGLIKDRVQFLKDNFPLMNLSKMTDDEYAILPTLIYRVLRLESNLEDAEVKPLRNLTVNLAGRCPHCRNVIGYPNYEYIFSAATQCCPVCGNSVNVNAIEYVDSELLSKNVDELLVGANAAIWAVTPLNYYWLLKAIPALKSDNVYFINRNRIIVPDSNNTVKTLGGKEVFTPDIIRTAGIDTIIVPNRPSVFHEVKQQCAVEFPQVKRIAHITELLGHHTAWNNKT